MKKTVFAGLVLAAFVVGGVYAQTQGSGPAQKHETGGGERISFAVDTVPLVKGFIAGNSNTSVLSVSPVLEFGMGEYSMGARADMIFGKVNDASTIYFGLAASGRWYPLATMEKLYIGAELGFNTCKMESVTLYTGLTYGLRAGWKHIVSNFFLEPSLGYILSKTDAAMQLTPFGWQIGLNMGVAL
jgi:hypothetical protein